MNGDLSKIRHIIDGIVEKPASENDNSLIFKQFGRSLRTFDQPIIDQHILRAFQLKDELDAKKITSIRKKSVYTFKDNRLLTEYIEWFQKRIKNVAADDQQEFKVKSDKILFIEG